MQFSFTNTFSLDTNVSKKMLFTSKIIILTRHYKSLLIFFYCDYWGCISCLNSKAFFIVYDNNNNHSNSNYFYLDFYSIFKFIFFTGYEKRIYNFWSESSLYFLFFQRISYQSIRLNTPPPSYIGVRVIW